MKSRKAGSSPKTARPSKVLPSQEPLPEVTAPRYSDAWMEQVDTRNQVSAIREGFRRRALRLAQESASQAASEPAKTKQAKP